MSLKESQGYVSIIGFNYLEPICSLLEKLESLDSREPNEVQASQFENGYSAAIIVLTVFLIESAIGRTQYDLGETLPKKPLEFVRTAFPDSGFFGKLEELFVVRDVIAHNHVWEARFLWNNDDVGMTLIAAELLKGYGDKKFNRVLDPTNRKTRLLGINLFPTRICHDDAVLVLKNAVEFLIFLEDEGGHFMNISLQYVMFNGELRPFTEIVANL